MIIPRLLLEIMNQTVLVSPMGGQQWRVGGCLFIYPFLSKELQRIMTNF